MKKSPWYFVILILSISLPVHLHAKGNSENAIPVTADAGKVLADVSPYVINGFNLNNQMQVYTIKNLIDKLKITTITYPAGDIGENRDLLNDYELTYFKSQQEYVGTPFTFVQARISDSTPEQAAEVVLLVKKLGIRVDVWTIGNEPNLFSSKKRDPSWTPEKYNSVFREYALAMRAKDPDIKLGGPATSQPVDIWIRSFINECGDIVDVLVWHWYPTDGKKEDAYALSTANQANATITHYKDWLKDPDVNPKGYDRDIKTAITEWGISWDSGRFRHLTDMTGVLWSAHVLGIFAETGIDYAHYFCLSRYGGHAIFNRIDKPLLLYYLFAMYADHFGPQVIAAGTDDPELVILATKFSEKDFSFFIINQNPGEEKNVAIFMDQFHRIRKAKAWELTNERRYKQIPANRIKKVKNQVVLKAAPYSLTVVRMGG